jgi:hypothetical protein
VPSDGIAGSEVVRGIVMNSLPDQGADHASTGTQSCYACHGSDYASPTGFNVHHPDLNPNAQPFGGFPR